jgi:L-alanine-DL-glutamate epimerase-like enolase superfamily enzyme
MRIVKLEWRGVKIPLGVPDEAGHRELTRYGLLLWIQTADGLMGVGEASPPGPASERGIADVAAMLHDVAPSALGLSPVLAFDVLSSLLPRTTEGDLLRFGLETATLDILGQLAFRPVADLLRGVIDWVPMSADISFVDPDEAARQAEAAVADGYRCVKVSLGSRDPDVDVAVVSQVREAVGPEVALRGDADGVWTPEWAIDVIKRLEPFNLEFVEQPVMDRDLIGMAQVRRAVDIPIAADESVTGLAEAQKVIEAEAADVLVVKLASAGGIRNAQTIMELAREHSLRTVVTCGMETGVGVAASLHVASSLGAASAAGLATGVLLEDDLLTSPLVPVRGHITVPQMPGLGIEVNRDAVDRYTTGVMGVIAG